MFINIQTTGDIQKVKNTLKNGGQKLVRRVILLTMNDFETNAKKNIRKSVYQSEKGKYKRSGKALQSITGRMLSNSKAKVFMGVDYGRYLETGTGIYNDRTPFWTTFGGLLDKPIKYKGMKARPFWQPAVEQTKKNIPILLKKANKEILKSKI